MIDRKILTKYCYDSATNDEWIEYLESMPNISSETIECVEVSNALFVPDMGKLGQPFLGGYLIQITILSQYRFSEMDRNSQKNCCNWHLQSTISPILTKILSILGRFATIGGIL